MAVRRVSERRAPAHRIDLIGSDETYAVNNLTNRYDATGSFDIQLTYDDAGNLTTDKDSYTWPAPVFSTSCYESISHILSFA